MLLAECAMQDVCLINDRSEAQILIAAADLVAAARAAATAADSAATAAAAAAAERPSSPAEAPAQEQQQQDSVDSHLQSALEAICCVVTNGLEVCRMTPRVFCKIYYQQKIKPHFIQSTNPIIVVITCYDDIVIMPTFPRRNRLQCAGGARGGRAGLQQRRTAAAARRRRLQVTPQAPLLCLLPVHGLLTPPSRRALAYMRFLYVNCSCALPQAGVASESQLPAKRDVPVPPRRRHHLHPLPAGWFFQSFDFFWPPLPSSPCRSACMLV